jgi:uncharacterized protein YoxC
MDSSKSSANIHKDDVAPFGSATTAVKVGPGGPARDPNGSVSTAILPEEIDVTAEETCPAPSLQMSVQDASAQPAPVTPTVTPSATRVELISQLDALAQEMAAKGRPASDQGVGNSREEPKLSDALPDEPKPSSGLPAVEPTIHVPPRSGISFESDFASTWPPVDRRKVFTLTNFFIAALIGVGFAAAWQSHRVWSMKSSNDANVATEQSGSASSGQASASDAAPPQTAPVTQTAAAPATSPDLVKQLEKITQDLTVMRRDVEQLAAKQEQLTAAQQQIEQLAAKQEQLAQKIAKLPAPDQSVRQRMPHPTQSRAAPTQPRAPPETPAQLSSAPRSAADHPVPPLPVPH